MAFDYLALLQSELEARGLDYNVVATTIGTDVEVPSATGKDIRLTDREVILARADVTVENVQGTNFSINLELPIGGPQGLPVTFLRGWVSVDATIDGQTVRFASTHLERAVVEPVQLAQAQELQGILSSSPFPVILVGDFNSRADGSGTGTYGMLVGGGFVDAWSQAYPGEDGYTCCHADDLLNPAPEFNQRIDLVFLDDAIASMGAEVVGIDQAGRTPSGLWPSDHAGMVAHLSMGVPTAVLEEYEVNLPESYVLEQNYPNPFNSSTVIRFALPQSEEVELTILNLAGQQVATLVQGGRKAGTYAVHWDGRDDSERDLASGMYLYRLRAGTQAATRRLLLLR